MHGKRIAIAFTAVALLLLAPFGIWRWLSGDDPAVARVRELQQGMMQRVQDAGDSMTDDQLRAMFTEVRAEMEKLDESQRRQLREEMGNQFRQRMTDEIHRFQQLTGKERTAFLDQQIDRMENRGNGPPWGNRRPPGADGSQRDRGPTANVGSQQEGRTQGGPPWGRANMSEEDRMARRRGRLDGTTAEQRAEFATFIEAIRERRKARGLPDRGGRPF
jgi:hypothetical protein